MRVQRRKIGIDDFEQLTVIGKGAFGEVGSILIVQISLFIDPGEWNFSELSEVAKLVVGLCLVRSYLESPRVLYSSSYDWPSFQD